MPAPRLTVHYRSPWTRSASLNWRHAWMPSGGRSKPSPASRFCLLGKNQARFVSYQFPPDLSQWSLSRPADSAMAPALFVTIDMLQSARSTKQQYEGYRKHDNYNIDSAFSFRSGRSVLLHAAGNERSS